MLATVAKCNPLFPPICWTVQPNRLPPQLNFVRYLCYSKFTAFYVSLEPVTLPFKSHNHDLAPLLAPLHRVGRADAPVPAIMA